MAWKLAEMYVQITEKGLAIVNEKLGTVKSHLEQVEGGMQKMQRAGQVVFATLTGTVAGFATAGLQGSAYAAQFGLQMGYLSRQIAGLFRPEIEKVIGWLTKLVGWFRSLSDAQRDNIARWVMGAGAAALVAIALPKVVAGITAVTAGFKALTAAIAGTLAGTGFGAFLPIIGFVVSGLTALFVGTEMGRNGLSRLWAGVKPLLEAFSNLGAALWKAFGPAISGALELTAKAFTTIAKAMAGFVNMIAAAIDKMTDLAKRLAVVRLLLAGLGGLPGLALAISSIMGTAPGDKGNKPNRREMEMQGGPPEAITATFMRFQQAALKTDSIPQKSLDALEAIQVSTSLMPPLMEKFVQTSPLGA